MKKLDQVRRKNLIKNFILFFISTKNSWELILIDKIKYYIDFKIIFNSKVYNALMDKNFKTV